MTLPLGPLLALETATPTARVAVFDAAGARLAGGMRTAARHSSNLLPLVDEALRTAGLRVDDLAAIACGAGPGSFTGLRVGLAVAKGLALPFATPLVLVSSLEALAHDLAPGAPAGATLVPCLDAGKEQVYAQRFALGEDGALVARDDPWTIGAEALCDRLAAEPGPVRLGGTGGDRFAAVFDARLGEGLVRQAAGPTAESVARLARVRLGQGPADDLALAVPVYGRAPDITTPKRRP